MDFLVRWVLPTFATIIVLVFLRRPGKEPISRGAARAWAATAIIVFLLTRIAFAWWIYTQQPLSYLITDLGWFRGRYVFPMMEGNRAGIDFRYEYGPLFPHLMYTAALYTRSVPYLGMIAVFIMGDAICLVGAALLGQSLGGRRVAEWALGWMLIAPITWFHTVLFGQDEPLFLATLLISAALLVRRRALLAGLALGVGLCVTKVSMAPYAIAIVIAASVDPRSALRYCLGAATPCLAVLAVFTAAGASVIPEFKRSLVANMGVSLPDLLTRLGIPCQSVGLAAAATAVTGLLLLVVERWMRERSMVDRVLVMLGIAHGMFMLFVPFCLPPYAAQGVGCALLAVVVLRESPARAFLFFAFAVLSLMVVMWWTSNIILARAVLPASLLLHGTLLWALIVDTWRRRGESALQA